MDLGYIDEFGNEEPEFVTTNRVGEVFPIGPGPCPVCSEPTLLRDGQFGKFYGCTLYPACKESRYYV